MKYIVLIITLVSLNSCNSSKNPISKNSNIKLDTVNNKTLRSIKYLSESRKDNLIIDECESNIKRYENLNNGVIEYFLNEKKIYSYEQDNCYIYVEIFDDSYLIISILNINKDNRPSGIQTAPRNKLFLFDLNSTDSYVLNLDKSIEIVYNKQILLLNGVLSDEDLNNNYIKTYSIEDIDEKSISLLGKNNKVRELKISKIEKLPIVCGNSVTN